MRKIGRSCTSSRVTAPWLALSALPRRSVREAVTTTSPTVLVGGASSAWAASGAQSPAASASALAVLRSVMSGVRGGYDLP
jgi:hypothetical protein